MSDVAPGPFDYFAIILFLLALENPREREREREKRERSEISVVSFISKNHLNDIFPTNLIISYCHTCTIPGFMIILDCLDFFLRQHRTTNIILFH